MTPTRSLDLTGTLSAYPFAELIVEIAQGGLSGSLRLENGERRSMVYFRDGAMVHAVSNAKVHRLFSLLLERSLIEQADLKKYPNFANDFEFTAALRSSGDVPADKLDAVLDSQAEAVVIDLLTWTDGTWAFSALSRLKEGMGKLIDISQMLAEFARCMPARAIESKFKSVDERFTVVPGAENKINLQLHEGYALSCFTAEPTTIGELRQFCSLPESGLFQALYVLWLAGFLTRADWNSAFPPAKIAEFRNARVALVKDAATIAANDKAARPEPEPEPAAEPPADEEPELALSVEEYLAASEAAETHYETLGLEPAASSDEIKKAYFARARLFHPDRFHRESPELLRRIELAFSMLANAYDVLKGKDSRANYDYKIKKKLEEQARRKAEGKSETPAPAEQTGELGHESFEHGLECLEDEEFDAAAGYLARAVHYSPKNALYHAYFGKALSANPKNRHKAEAELQTAVRLEPANAKIRIMLANFLIEMKMVKRAEGELTRFLEASPDNAEVRALLNTLKN